ncbi:M28 family peptidase [Hufsiella ginkgonis]|uniref:M28 family peptidase n=1 Tax=Hufsiella ginkgonis TaxID=2695274 RepID=A0A7K1Y2R0_9SPHI|nr:M28 family peptidase [Hufsiella ginkgonis]MXV16966.1 M28 family peptidase [Hufsiella ginkgonis]
MRKQLLFTLSLGFATQLFAQDKFAQKYAGLITAEEAKKHLSILASDEYEGRETGKAGAEKAAQYIKKHFQSLGLKGPVKGDYFQNLELTEKLITNRSIAVNDKSLESKDFTIANYVGTKSTFTNFVFVGYGIQSPKYDDLTGVDLAGKVVVVLSGEPMVNGVSLVSGTATPSEWTAGRTPKKLTVLREKNPALIVTVSAGAQNAGGFQGRAGGAARPQLIMGKEKTQINSITLSADAVNQLMASAGRKVEDLQKGIQESGKSSPVTFTSSLTVDVQATYTPVLAREVLGFMEGSDPKLKHEVLVFSAHYDHIGLTTNNPNDKVNNGADDDGSGTTGILEIATAFAKAKKEKHGPRRSILFLGNVGEEKGLLGSEWYTDHPVFPLENTVADLNIDMIGRIGEEYIGKPDSANYVYVIGSAMLSTTLREVSEKANATYLNMVADYKYDDLNDKNRYYYRSDHYNFAKHNVPIIFYFNGVHADYHRPGDEVSKINFPLLAKRAQLAFYTGWDLANRDKRPVVDVKTVIPPR